MNCTYFGFTPSRLFSLSPCDLFSCSVPFYRTFSLRSRPGNGRLDNRTGAGPPELLHKAVAPAEVGPGGAFKCSNTRGPYNFAINWVLLPQIVGIRVHRSRVRGGGALSQRIVSSFLEKKVKLDAHHSRNRSEERMQPAP